SRAAVTVLSASPLVDSCTCAHWAVAEETRAEYFFRSCNCSATVVRALASINLLTARYSRMNGRQPSNAPKATQPAAVSITVPETGCAVLKTTAQAKAFKTTKLAIKSHFGIFHSETLLMAVVSEKCRRSASGTACLSSTRGAETKSFPRAHLCHLQPCRAGQQSP